jgi:hypothetical protein
MKDPVGSRRFRGQTTKPSKAMFSIGLNAMKRTVEKLKYL